MPSLNFSRLHNNSLLCVTQFCYLEINQNNPPIGKRQPSNLFKKNSFHISPWWLFFWKRVEFSNSWDEGSLLPRFEVEEQKWRKLNFQSMCTRSTVRNGSCYDSCRYYFDWLATNSFIIFVYQTFEYILTFDCFLSICKLY